ncbi:MAG: hypothetical protein IKR09_08900 [Alphaproteobacteria bacterium]|nr:hypothetical protein [Alphaproteobacteria bacterium]
MTSDSFSKTVQTFGVNLAHRETNQRDVFDVWAATDGAAVLQTEKALDDLLNTVRPPSCSGLAERIYATVLNETARRQILLFWRLSPWISLACAVFGFCLGWYQNHADTANMQSYFNTMFDLFYEQY